MTITYVNDLRLSEMATGDNSGTWGNVTNTNLELIGDALGYGTEAITTNADTHSSTIADGSADAARAMYIKYTGTLDSACTITIGPNTISRVHIIENATSGSQNIIIKQGSGATVTIGSGAVKMVYLDGAGSGAAVTDALVDLDLTGTTTVASLTSSGNVGVGDSSPSNRLSVVAADGDADNAYVATFQNQEATDDRNFGVLIKAGSTATDSSLVVTDHDASNNLFFVKGNGNTFIAGDVGIGTANPQRKLVLYQNDSGQTQIQFQNQTTGTASSDGFGVGLDTQEDGFLWNYEGGDIYFGRASTRFMTLEGSSGNVGIGTTNPSAGLTLEGTDGATSTTFMLTSTGVASAGLACDANGLNFGADTGGFVFKTGASANDPTDSGTRRMIIQDNGEIGEFELGNLKVIIKDLSSYEKELIVCE